MTVYNGAGTYVGTMQQRLIADRNKGAYYVWQERQYKYDQWDAYYKNTIYHQTSEDGFRDQINRQLGGAAAEDLAGLYNPVKSVVDLYLHVFGGSFGDDIVVETVGTKATSKLVDAIELIWKASNIDVSRQQLCRIAARCGIAGIRIVADAERKMVYFNIEHPRIIRDVELDRRGNVTAIQLEYMVTRGLGESAETFVIREEMTKTDFRTFRVINDLDSNSKVEPFDLITMTPDGPNSVMINDLGVVPYVLCYHAQSDEDVWGLNAFSHALDAIDRLNSQISHVDVQIHRIVKAKWLVITSGEPPEEFDLSDGTIVYINSDGSTGSSSAQPMVAPLDFEGAIAQAKLQLELVENRLSELKAVDGRFLSGQSGETIAELRKPAEECIMLARTHYEDAMIRAQQIAVSLGVALELWDVGTGTGLDAAERAYRDGYEDHRFNKRPAMTVEDDEQVDEQEPAAQDQVDGNQGERETDEQVDQREPTTQERQP